ncbi:nucleotidyltransferase [Brachyspira murdochii]|uniref:nucleotidyltransferase domain-containing protein n=1 Tax=Brachyspira murdochii TaxID=84378 RepID=UPI003007342B
MYNNIEIEELLKKIAENIDISKEAYKTYLNYKKQLKKEYFDYELYAQGSIRLGTVIKNYNTDKEEKYDIDIVLKFIGNKIYNPNSNDDAAELKSDSNPKNKNLNMDFIEEIKVKKPCWTLKLKNNISIDLIPAINNDDASKFAYNEYSLYTTREYEYEQYEWKHSNPIGYYRWFKKINEKLYNAASIEQMKNFSNLEFDYIEKKALVRTNLQRAIQILKYLRDMYFYNKPNKDYKPISIIITTLVAGIYNKKITTSDTIYDIIKSFIIVSQYIIYYKRGQKQFSREDAIILDPIKELYLKGNIWYLPNPTDPEENFMERWNDPKDNGENRVDAFFEWIDFLDNIFSDYSKLKNFLEDDKDDENGDNINIYWPYGY